MDSEKMNVEMLKKRYPKGTRICLDYMEGKPQMPHDLKGEVFAVDDIGQIHVAWENGSTLALNVNVDSFHTEKIQSKDKKKEGVSR